MPAAVRGTSAGALKNGGRARIAVIETAPAIPMTAVAATMASDDVTKIIINRNAASIVGPKTRNGHARIWRRLAVRNNTAIAKSCEPLSQPSAAPSSSGLPSVAIVSEKGAGDEIGAVGARIL